MSAPQPPAKESEIFHPKGYELWLLPWLFKSLNLICGTLDILATLSTTYPSSPISSISSHFIHYPPQPPTHTLYLISALTSLSGGLFRLWCYRTLGNLFTFELSIQSNHKLITTGPYSIVRHPSYLGAALSLCGALSCYVAPGSWLVEELGALAGPAVSRGLVGVAWTVAVVVAATTLVPRVRMEDEVLRKEFGKEWDEWAGRVPRRLVPGVY